MNSSDDIYNLNRANVGDDACDPQQPSGNRERRYIAFVLLAISLFTLGDLVEDRLDGAPWAHVLSELGVVIVATGVAFHLFRLSRAPLIEKGRLLERELVKARDDAKEWQQEASQLLHGLSAAISATRSVEAFRRGARHCAFAP